MTTNISFVYPFWQHGANYDELRWSIRSIYQNFRPAEGQTFDVWLIGDQPVVRRTSSTWHSGNIVPCPRTVKGRGFKNKLTDALNKWHTAIHHPGISDTTVWMMDDIYFVNPVTLEELSVPRAHRRKTERNLQSWNENSGFSSAKKRTVEALLNAGYPAWDFATHLPHVVQKERAKQVFNDFRIQDDALLWEIVYENVFLEDRQPLKMLPFARYFDRKPEFDVLNVLHRPETKAFVGTGGSWNEAFRRFLFQTFPNRSPVEVNDPPAPRPDPALRKKLMEKVLACSHRGQVSGVALRPIGKRRTIELPVFQCLKFGQSCMIDGEPPDSDTLVCKQCPVITTT